MKSLTLNVTKPLENAKVTRESGLIPMIYYGEGQENIQFAADYQEFKRVYDQGGRSTIINFITEDKKEYPVLVHEVQYNPVTDEFLHIDVKAVDMNKPIQTEVTLTFVGISPAVKNDGGVLMHNREKVDMECLPKDLVHDIEVDISSLVDFNTRISVGDIKVPEGITIIDAPEITVATVSAPRVEVEAVSVPEGEAGAEGEAKEDAEKGEGGAGAEGEAKEDAEKATE